MNFLKLKFILPFKYYLLFLIFSIPFVSNSQELTRESLEKLEGEELLTLLKEVRTDTVKAEMIGQLYLRKEKVEKDTLEILNGYNQLARIFNPIKNIKYADSIILYSTNVNNETYPILGYILKAREYNNIGNVKEATENFLTAYEYAVKNNNTSHQAFILGRLIFLKSIWGDKKEALALQKKRHTIITSLYENQDSKNALKDELTSLFNYSFCYLNLQKLDSAAIYANKGLQKSNAYEGDDIDLIVNYFKEILVEINYYQKNYNYAIKSSDSLLLKLEYENYKESFQNLYFFKGNALINNGQYQEGITYLKKSDSIFESENFQIRQPYQRKLFEVLLEHNKNENNQKEQIKYLNKLIATDSILIKNYQYFEPNLIKNFETPKLIEEKEKLIENLTKKNEKKSNTIWWILAALAITLITLGYYYYREQVFKKRFNSLLLQHDSTSNPDENRTFKNKISKKIVENILEQLSAFETNKDFLSPDISIQKLAKSFETNYKYLSSVVNLYKEKSFSSYINDLRVEYAFNEIKSDPKIRKYTVKAISKEFGFKSAESFSRAFYKRFGIYPSYYITQLEKTLDNN